MTGYLGKTHSHLNHSDKAALSGFIFLMLSSFFSLLIVGILNRTDSAVFNCVVSLFSHIGILLVLGYSDITSSATLVWWFLFASVIYLMTVDVQAGGTIRVRNSLQNIKSKSGSGHSVQINRASVL